MVEPWLPPSQQARMAYFLITAGVMTSLLPLQVCAAPLPTSAVAAGASWCHHCGCLGNTLWRAFLTAFLHHDRRFIAPITIAADASHFFPLRRHSWHSFPLQQCITANQLFASGALHLTYRSRCITVLSSLLQVHRTQIHFMRSHHKGFASNPLAHHGLCILAELYAFSSRLALFVFRHRRFRVSLDHCVATSLLSSSMLAYYVPS